MDDCADLEKILAVAQKALTELEVQAAIYTESTIPVPLKLQRNEKREEVEGLKARLKAAQLEKTKAQKTVRSGVSHPSAMRSRVSDEHYIERDEAKKLLERFKAALQEPDKHPLLFNICGIGGVGKTTLRDRLQKICADEVDFLEVCFAKTADIETPLKLMRKLHQQAVELLGVQTSTDVFTQQDQQFETALFELSKRSVDGRENSSEEARKITSWFERFIWLGTASFTSTSSRPKSYGAFESGFSTVAATGEDAEGLQEWIQQRIRNHPATKDQPELQALMLEPVSKLTQAFAKSLMQMAQCTGRSLVLILDTYEKAQAYLNQWLWQYLVEDTPLYSAPVRLVVVGRRPLQADEGWRKLNQDRKLLYETQLQRFSRKDTDDYLQRIGIQNGGTRAKIYKATQGLPYYLDWVRKQWEEGKEPDFSQGNRAIAELLLQGIDSPQKRKVLQVVACCRWFHLAMLRYLLGHDSSGLQQDTDHAESYFEWLKQSDFVELTKGRYRLDDVARDVFRQSYFQEDQNQFHKTNAVLAGYFKQQADELYEPQSLLPDPYKDEEWRELMAEFLYYSLFGKRKKGLHDYIEQVFVSTYLREPDVFLGPYFCVRAEINEENQSLLPKATGKFFEDSAIALELGWFFLDKDLKKYKLEFTGGKKLADAGMEKRLKKLEDSLQDLLEYVEDLQDGFGKCVGLIYKSMHCNRFGEITDSLLQAKSQAEQLLAQCRPTLLSSLFTNLGSSLNDLGGLLNDINLYQDSLKRYEEALASYQKAIEIGPKSARAWINLGHTLDNLERYEEALASYQKAIEIDPKSVRAWINLGFTLDRLERYEEALASYQKAIEIDSKSVRAWVTRGFTLNNIERYEEALASYQKAIEIDPKFDIAWINRGHTLDILERYEEALASYQKAIEIDPEDSLILNAQALTLSFLGAFEEAIAAIDTLISLKPEKALYKANRGIILARAGRYTEALAECEKAIQQNPQHESGYYAKACYYALQSGIEPAIDNLQKAIEIAPLYSRLEAKYNPDFDSIRSDERFRSLVYSESNR